VPVGRLRKLSMGRSTLAHSRSGTSFSGCAEPLRRMLRILLEERIQAAKIRLGRNRLTRKAWRVIACLLSWKIPGENTDLVEFARGKVNLHA